jgi:biuret amidohydrolase
VNRFGVDEIRPAVVTIDLHRGHLDPEVATLPLPADVAARVVEANVRFLDAARALEIPVVHVVTGYRDADEIGANPYWRAIADTGVTRSNILRHNLLGLPGQDLMPGICDPERDRIVNDKKRYDCFLGTDLAITLHAMKVNTLLITGVNTNSCVLATTITAQTRDFACIVVSDCVDTCDGLGFHESALNMIERAFGWVMSADESLEAVGSGHRHSLA